MLSFIRLNKTSCALPCVPHDTSYRVHILKYGVVYIVAAIMTL